MSALSLSTANSSTGPRHLNLEEFLYCGPGHSFYQIIPYYRRYAGIRLCHVCFHNRVRYISLYYFYVYVRCILVKYSALGI